MLFVKEVYTPLEECKTKHVHPIPGARGGDKTIVPSLQ